jgi:DNA mismatch repair protein MutS
MTHPSASKAGAIQSSRRRCCARAAGFVPNDCELGPERRLWLLTGPNMAGKSTFLRQNALIAGAGAGGLLRAGEQADIGIVDRLFSRVGAADDLARGRSTFMVEMVETAAILNQATAKSLVILDEIGRGTATFDGLSIAWATLEHLHDVNKCRALFATHYHELGALKERLAALAPLHHARQGVAERGRVPARGGARRGRPLLRHPRRPACGAARCGREARRGGPGGAGEGRAVGRGDAARRRPAAIRRRAAPPTAGVARAVESEVEKALAAVNPDELTPKQALELLYELRRLKDG